MLGGMDDGILDGIEEGILEGIAEGMLEGIDDGMLEGIDEGIEEGIAEGGLEGTEGTAMARPAAATIAAAVKVLIVSECQTYKTSAIACKTHRGVTMFIRSQSQSWGRSGLQLPSSSDPCLSRWHHHPA